MKFLASIFLFVFVAFSSKCQIDLSRYLDESTIPVFSLEDYIHVKFDWNMKGDVQLHLNEGLNYLEEENLDLAIFNMSRVIELDPNLFVGYYYRGICYKKLGRLDEATKDFEKARAMDFKRAETYIELGEIAQMTRKFDEAAKLYDRAIDIDPSIGTGYYNLALVEFARSLGQSKKVFKLLDRCNEKASGFAPAYVLQGVLRFKETRKNEQSIGFLTQALKVDSTHSNAYFWRGLMFMSSGENQKCLADWSSFLRRNSDNTFMRMMRGFLYIELNRFDEAFTDLRKAFLSREINQENFKGSQTILDKQIDLQAATHYVMRNGYGLKDESFAHIKRGYCLLLSDKNVYARDNFLKAAELEPSATVYFLLGIVSEHLNDFPSAFEYYDKTLALDNDIFDVHKKRSIYRSNIKDWKGAFADLNDMIRLQPETMMTYRLRGLIKSSRSDYYGAIIDFTTYLKFDSTDVEILKTRGICRANVKDQKGAIDDFNKALDLTPKEISVLDLIVHTQLQSGDTLSAHETLDRIISYYPAEVFHSLYQAEVYISGHQWEKSNAIIVKLLTRYSEKSSSNDYIKLLFHHGVIQFNLGNYDLAIRQLSKAVDLDSGNPRMRYMLGKSCIAGGKTGKAKKIFFLLADSGYLDSQKILDSLDKK